MTIIEKVQAADHIQWTGLSYVYLGEDDIEGLHQFKLMNFLNFYERLSVSEIEQYYNRGTMKLYKMVEL
jgi:hypothetical protein